MTTPTMAASASSPPRPHSPPANRRLFTLFVILAITAAGMSALLALFPAAGHDQLWFLLMARRWLGGAQLYGPEIFDSNPPGIIWLSALPVLLGHLLHLPTTLIAKLLVTLAETAASLLTFRFLTLAWRRPPRHEIAALLFAAIVLFYAVPARDFGQRDAMLAFLILPYVIAAGVNVSRHPLPLARIFAGILAGAAICLKPHHALIPIAVEMSLLIHPRLRSELTTSPLTPRSSPEPAPTRLRTLLRPEPVLIALTGILFLAAIRHFAPLYFRLALPVTRATYWAIGHLSVPALALEAIQLIILGLLTLILYFTSGARSRPVTLLHLAATAATLAYFLQGTGWYYQQLPAISLFAAALALQLLDRARDVSFTPPRWLVPLAAALCVLALALTTHFTGYPFTRDSAFAITTPDPAFFTPLSPGTPVAILTTSVDEAMMPIERYQLTWAQRTNNLWLLPAILRTESPDPEAQRHDLPTAERLSLLQRRWMVEDLSLWQPQLVLVERCQDLTVQCQVLEDRHDDLLAWFLRDPAFAGIWRRYTFAGRRGRFDAYNLINAPSAP